MPRDPVELTIGDVRYETIPYRFDKAINLKLKLASVLAGPLGQALGDLGDDDDAVDLRALGDVLSRVPSALLDLGGAELFREILSDTVRYPLRADGARSKEPLSDPINLDKAFAANLNELYDVLIWVLKVNYGPFLTALWERWKGQSSA